MGAGGGAGANSHATKWHAAGPTSPGRRLADETAITSPSTSRCDCSRPRAGRLAAAVHHSRGVDVRIRLIEPGPPGRNIYSYARYPRLGLPMIGAALHQHGHDIRIYNPQLASIDWRDVYAADLVGLSTITSTAPAAYRYADDLRARGIPVIIGGSHVTFLADEALEHADYVARGEGGEALMLELIDALQNGREVETIRGLSFMKDGRPVHNEPRERCRNLDELPLPDLSLIVGHERLTSTPVMTSWGCPFACSFCSVTTMFGHRSRCRSVESVVAELKQRQPLRIFFYDDNLAADTARLKRLLRAMIEADLVVPWTAQVRTDVVGDPELLDLMQRSGCDRLCLGLESVSQATLDDYAKSQSVDDIVRAIATLRRYRIKTHGMFVLGGDGDTVQTLRETATFALRHHIDSLMLNILTPGPGTRLYAEMNAQGRVLTTLWHLYDGQHVVFGPRHMTPDELQRETVHGYLRFYSTRRLLGYLFTLRVAKLRVHCWGWWYVRRWRREKANRAYVKTLRRQQWAVQSDH
jgi:anaerobic magnesium-protoporphyrin IX monomethyl ester cyclase